ncbi:MAG TPA: hypothetical protein VLX68_00890 [Chitinivibrionales bacterium]|nr:hypothetical protein [Chitinivibrionales bacterium]
MMKYNSQNHLLKILQTLSKAKVRHIVCGGVAVVLHGVERMTIDLDIALDFDPGNVRRFNAAMKRLSLVPRVPISAECLADKKQRETLIREKNALVFTFIDTENPFRMVDVLLTAENSYKALYAKSEKRKIGRVAVRVASKRQIISMKSKVRPLRDKDRFDINALKKAQ